MPGTLSEYFDGLLVKNGSAYQGLIVYPVCVIAPEFEGPREEYTPLDRALKKGVAYALETGEMDKIRIMNRAGKTIVIDGDTLIGGAQNRMLNSGAVFSGGQEAEIPSSCVEVHRWECGRDRQIPAGKQMFRNSDTVFGSLKRLKLTEALHSLHTDRRIEVDQRKVWKHIAGIFGVSGAKTDTLDLHDLYEFWEKPLQVFSRRFTFIPRQVGAISFLDRKTWFVDIFMNSDMLMNNFRRLVRSYSFDALIEIERGRSTEYLKMPSLKDARQTLKSLRLARLHSYDNAPATARGGAKNFFFSTSRICGTTLIEGDTLIHLTACSR